MLFQVGNSVLENGLVRRRREPRSPESGRGSFYSREPIGFAEVPSDGVGRQLGSSSPRRRFTPPGCPAPTIPFPHPLNRVPSLLCFRA